MTDLGEWINQPSRWPYRPYLPMRLFMDAGALTGYLMEGRGLTIFDDKGDVVEQFNSVDEMAKAGWQVD